MHVYAQHAAKQVAGGLRVVLRVTAAATITEGNVEVAIRAEGQHSRIVIPVRLIHFQDHFLAGQRCRV